MLKSIWNRKLCLRCIYILFFSVTLSHAVNNSRSLNHIISHNKNNWTHKIPMRKNVGPMKHPQEKYFNTENTTRKKFGPTKAQWHNGTRSMRPTKFNTYLSLRKNHLLKCWECLCLITLIKALTFSLLLKLPPRKLKSRFVL